MSSREFDLNRPTDNELAAEARAEDEIRNPRRYAKCSGCGRLFDTRSQDEMEDLVEHSCENRGTCASCGGPAGQVRNSCDACYARDYYADLADLL